jgi:hypothetical protein
LAQQACVASISLHELECMSAFSPGQIGQISFGQIIQGNDFSTTLAEDLRQIRANKTCATCDQGFHDLEASARSIERLGHIADKAVALALLRIIELRT